MLTWTPWLGCLVAAWLTTSYVAAQEAVESTPRSPASAEARTMQAEFGENGQLKLVLEMDALTLHTPYGKLVIPVEEIRQIDLATRVSEREMKLIEQALFNLGSSDFDLREEASRQLLALREKAYPALVKANKHADLEVAHRAQELVVKLREIVPEEHLVVREFDVIETQHSKLAGRIPDSSIQVSTTQFGKHELQLTEVRKLRSLLAAPEEVDPVNVLPDPGNLLSFHDRVGKSFAFKITGRGDGSCYGTGTYTTDSNLATAAVHSGALKNGQTGIVRITMLPSPASFVSSSQNGIISSAWGAYPAAYQIHVPKK